jgi:hypothetical protein
MSRTTGVRFPAGARYFSLLHSVQCPINTGDAFLEVRRPKGEARHSPPSSVEIKNGGAIPSTPPHVYMASA